MWLLSWYLAAATAKVVFVAEVCRHGSRAPTNSKLCPWDQDGRWDNNWGELTSVGMRMHFLLGRELRQRYVINQPTFGPEFNGTEIYVRSTDFNRTIMSAQSQLMGLFPPPTGPTLSDSMGDVAVPPITVQKEVDIVNALQNRALPFQFQSFPVHVVPLTDDWVLFATYTCYRLQEAIENPIYSEMTTNITNSNPYFLTALQSFTNLPTQEVADNLADIIDSIQCNQAMGFPLPASTPQLLENATVIGNELFSIYYANDLLVRYFSAWFFLDLAEHFEAVMQGTEPTKFRLYSAHDGTLAGFLAGLQVYDNKQPPFASSLIFEVSETNGDFSIRILYNDVPLAIGPCSLSECPLLAFIDYLYMRSFASEDVCLPPSSNPWSDTTNGGTDSIVPAGGSDQLKWEAWVAIAFCVFAILAVTGACIVSKDCKAETAYRQMDDLGSSSSSMPQTKVVNLPNP